MKMHQIFKMTLLDISAVPSVHIELSLNADSAGAPQRKIVCTEGPYGVHDVLRNGPRSIAHDLAPRHSLQSHLVPLEEDIALRKLELGGQQFGQHIPMRLRTEQSVMRGCLRLGGLPSCNLGMSILNGTDETIDMQDFINGT